ncbi:MAG: hypothetical protein HYY23_02940 [Verrucomicrobia bacterium]|nr:hypothetical protein [Verrucomicrobiota bacterium]
MTAATIKLRSDLIFSQQAGSEGTTIVIKDPVTERFFRFKEIEHFIAAQFDGQTPPELVLQRVEERFQVRLSPENLEQFIDRLRRLGLATDGAAGPAICPSAPKRVAGDALYLRFRAFNPDHLFDWLLPRVEFLFTPWFLAVSAGFVAAGLWVTLIHWSEILPEFGGLLRFESLLLAWIITSASSPRTSFRMD